MKKILPILTIGFILILFSLKIQAQTPTVTILAGSAGFLDSTLAYAQFRGPTDIVFNKKKNEYYVADKNNFRIRVIKGNTVSTLAGNGVSGSANGNGGAARLTGPTGLVLNKSGDTLYFADAAGNRDGRIRFVVLTGADSGKVVTIAGSFGGNPGPSNNEIGTQARFGGTLNSLILVNNAIYTSEYGSGSARLRKIELSGTYPVSSLDSNGTFTTNIAKGIVVGEIEGLSRSRFDTLIYIAVRNKNQINKVNLATGVISVLAGTGPAGSTNLRPLTSGFGNLAGLAFDSASNIIYVAEKGGNNINSGIRAIDLTNDTVRLIAGATNVYSFVDGAGNLARFNNPQNISFDSNGDLLVGDASNNRLRRIALGTNIVSTIAGNPSNDVVSNNPFSVRFNSPQSVIVDKNNNIFFADRNNHVIRKYNAVTKQVSIVAGKRGVTGSSNGPALDSALFNQPYGMALKNDSLFISDGNGNSPNGIRILNLTTNRVSLYAPIRGSLMVYKNSLLVFGDVDGGSSIQNRIIRFNLGTGKRDTIAGTGANGFTQGPGRLAQIFNPNRGAVWNDTLYFVTSRSTKPWRIRRLALNSPTFDVDTIFTRAQTEPLNNPSNLVIDKFGTLYIGNNAFGSTGVFRVNLNNKTIVPNIPGATLPNNISGLDFDTNRNALIASDGSNGRIIKIAPIYSIANVAPSFTLAKTKDTLFRKDNTLKTITGVATNLNANVSVFNTIQNQTVTIKALVPANQQALFSQLPAVTPEGVLTYKLVDNVPFTSINNITVAVSIRAKDNGGTADGGVDSSAAQTFNIVIRYQNLAPAFNITQDTVTILSTVTNAQTLANFFTGVSSGIVSEPGGQNLTFVITNDNAAIFATAPALTGTNAIRNLTLRTNGTLGLANIRVVCRDNGGIANGAIDSIVKTFVIRVVLVNSVSANLERSEISFMPNPTASTVSFPGVKTGSKIEFIDQKGRSQSFIQTEMPIDIKHLSKGIYFVRVIEKGVSVYAGKLVKE